MPTPVGSPDEADAATTAPVKTEYVANAFDNMNYDDDDEFVDYGGDEE
jgi:hypothetical protein